MGRRSENHRGFVVSCRLNEAEMEALQNMSLMTDCSVSDLLRRGLRNLTQSTSVDSVLRVINGN